MSGASERRTQIFILGAGTPTPTPFRFGSSLALKIDNEHLMFDCGPAATYKLVKAGISPTQVNHLFFTHHHFDHDSDYPCLLLCRWDQGAGLIPDLKVYGPKLTESITDRILNPDHGAFSHDWKARVNTPTSQHVYVNRGGVLPRQPPRTDVRDIEPGAIVNGHGWRVVAALAEHVQPFLDSLAYRVETPDSSIVITGDTQPCSSVVELSRDADTLICMCWDDQETMERNGEAPGQCGTEGAARMAQEAGVRRLVLTHMGPHLSAHGPLEKGIGDVRRIFSGEVIFAEEQMVLSA